MNFFLFVAPNWHLAILAQATVLFRLITDSTARVYKRVLVQLVVVDTLILFELFTMQSAMVSHRLATHLGTALPWPAPPFTTPLASASPLASGLLTTQPTRLARGTQVQAFTTPLR